MQPRAHASPARASAPLGFLRESVQFRVVAGFETLAASRVPARSFRAWRSWSRRGGVSERSRGCARISPLSHQQSKPTSSPSRRSSGQVSFLEAFARRVGVQRLTLFRAPPGIQDPCAGRRSGSLRWPRCPSRSWWVGHSPVQGVARCAEIRKNLAEIEYLVGDALCQGLGRTLRVSRAMAAGVSATLWSVDDVLNATIGSGI